MFCKANTNKVAGKKQFPKKVTTFEAAEQIKKAAEKKNNEKLLVAIAGQDLIAKEFKKHEKFIVITLESSTLRNKSRQQLCMKMVTTKLFVIL